MTEYDYSPEAFEAFMHKQYKISTWVDKTNKSPPCNPFTPATPAVHAALALEDERRHRRKDSRDSSSRRREDRDRDRRSDKESTSHSSSRHPPSTSASRPSRHRSSSSTTTPPRPEHHRSRSIPQPLQLGPYANGYMSTSQLSSSPKYQQYQYPRDSKHSSQTSSSTRNPPHSAPLPRPLRSQTTPPNYGYPVPPQGSGGASGPYPNASTPYLVPSSPPLSPVHNCPNKTYCSLIQNAPQLPHSYYTTPKQPPLIKRLFKSITGGNKQQHKPPTRKRSMSF
ncbi:hypothetical protein CPB83DRAFT_473110 [Crepidotus variabilis]|uniref:Uncharacterized protein n=1 Tax=Crepidotus variabilis TaxID=179855 RepID=A0A9P6JV24_9AGAR|nr:hypothetical protein CPB83DRAFT_473110 [Crepidotus variabilis]